MLLWRNIVTDTGKRWKLEIPKIKKIMKASTMGDEELVIFIICDLEGKSRRVLESWLGWAVYCDCRGQHGLEMWNASLHEQTRDQPCSQPHVSTNTCLSWLSIGCPVTDTALWVWSSKPQYILDLVMSWSDQFSSSSSFRPTQVSEN